MEKIKIVITGHTNTGKTSLIRTLMKSPVGEVGDKANVTKKGETYFYQGLQANFVDTPGFRFASIYNMYLDAVKDNPTFKMPKNWASKISLEKEAINEIDTSDVAIYVGALDVVPDDEHYEEIKLVQKLQPRMVGLLNKSHYLRTSKGEEVLKNRISQWNEYFYDLGIDESIIFDAHWDKYSKTNDLYDKINLVISNRDRKVFNIGLDLFKKRQEEIREEACTMLAICIRKIQNVSLEVKQKDHIEEESAKKILEITNKAFLEFINSVNKLYVIAAENPTIPAESIKKKIKLKSNWKKLLGKSTSGIAYIGSMTALLGASLGAVGAGLVSGGLGIVAGAVSGAKLGGAIGSGLGSLIFLNRDDLILEIKPNFIQDIFLNGIATIWGLSVSGYSRNEHLKGNEILKLTESVKGYITNTLDVNWATINSQDIKSKSVSIIRKLENEW